jgi:hypothetical protein
MEEKDRKIIAESIGSTMPISKYESMDEWYESFKKNFRKMRKKSNKD